MKFLRLPIPFHAARLQEAIDAVSLNYWEMWEKRIRDPKHQAAIRRFLCEAYGKDEKKYEKLLKLCGRKK